jgi:hypothetical protein
MMQFPNWPPIHHTGVLSNGAITTVSCKVKCKIVWSDWGAVPEKEKEALWKLIKAHYIFPSNYVELGKTTTILTVGRFHGRFMHTLNKFYVQPGVSSLNRFSFTTPNEWNTF